MRVIKVGGNALMQAQALADFAQQVAALDPEPTVIVHGGGPQIDALAARLGLASTFVDGRRRTDAALLEVVEMVLCGGVNKALVRALNRVGIAAVGLSAQEGSMAQAQAQDGRVGRVTDFRPAVLETLLLAGYCPVLAPIAADAEGALNINADDMAAAVAGRLGADTLYLLTNVPGLRDAQGQVRSALDERELSELRAAGVIAGGMIPKVEAALAALHAGCRSVRILDRLTATGSQIKLDLETP